MTRSDPFWLALSAPPIIPVLVPTVQTTTITPIARTLQRKFNVNRFTHGVFGRRALSTRTQNTVFHRTRTIPRRIAYGLRREKNKRNATNADRDQIKNVRVDLLQRRRTQRSVMTCDDITCRPPFYRCGYVSVTSAVGVNPRYRDNVTCAE